MNQFRFHHIFCRKLKNFNLETLEGRAQAAAFLIPIINKINNSVIPEVYALEVSSLCGLVFVTLDMPSHSHSRPDSDLRFGASSYAPVRVLAVFHIFSAILSFPSIAAGTFFD
jgi:DnaB-helicase binding domain of primase.